MFCVIIYSPLLEGDTESGQKSYVELLMESEVKEPGQLFSSQEGRFFTRVYNYCQLEVSIWQNFAHFNAIEMKYWLLV